METTPQADQSSIAREGGAKRRWVKGVLVIVGVLALITLGTAWYLSGLILDGAAIKPDTGQYDKQVVAIDALTITYHVTQPAEDIPGDDYTLAQVGMQFQDGKYLLLGQDAKIDGQTITRRYTQLRGERPSVGATAKYDWNSYPDSDVLGLPRRDVTYDAPLGPTPAVIVDAAQPAGVWAIQIHGRGASIRETLRNVQALHDHNVTSMLINYRDDIREPGAPYEDGVGSFGATEWPDLQAAVEYARTHGANKIILVGYSMGGAITASYLEHGEDTSAIIGTLLDSPAVSFHDMTVWGAEQKGLSAGLLRPVIWTAERMTELRSSIDYTASEYIDNASTWPVPAAVVAGTEDNKVPYQAIEEFANALPDGQFLLFDPASHVGEWNYDQQKYDAFVNAWLDELLGT